MTTTAQKEPETKAATNGKPDGEPKFKPLLELSTVAPVRPVVSINTGKVDPETGEPDLDLYEFRMLEEFGAVDHQEYNRDLAEYEELWGSRERLNKAEKKRYVMLLDRLFAQVVIGGDGLLEILSGAQKRQVVMLFPYAPTLQEAMAQDQTANQTEQTGDRSTSET